MKRILSLILSALLLASAVACSEAPVEDEGNESVQSAPSIEDSAEETEELTPYALLEKKSFEGQTYAIYEIGANSLQKNVHSGEITGEIVNDALYNRDLAISKDFDVTIQYYQDDLGTGNTNLNTTIKAGDYIYNLTIAPILDQQKNAATGQLLTNLHTLPHVEIAEEWYSPLMAEAVSLGGAMYFTASDLAPGVYQSPCCMFLNLKLYEDYNIQEDIYQLVIDGEWTIDKLYEIIKDFNVDLDNNGTWTAEGDQFGLVLQNTSETSTAFFAAADASLAGLTDDKSTIALDINEHTYSVLEKLRNVCLNITHQDINNPQNLCFKVDKALFLQHKLESAATHLRDMESDYLVLPDPKADLNQDHYISMVSGYCTAFMSVPVVDTPELTGLITEALARYSHENIRPLAFDTVYKNKDARDPRTATVLDILLDNLYIDFGICYDYGGINSLLTSALFNDLDLASGAKARTKMVSKLVAAFLEKWTENK